MESPQMKRAGMLGAFLVIVGSIGLPVSHAEPPQDETGVVFDIPPGNAATTLLEFYVQSNVQVLFLSDAVEGVITQAVHGRYEPAAALAIMLQGTELAFEFESGHSAVIVRRAAGHQSGALSGSNESGRPVEATAGVTQPAPCCDSSGQRLPGARDEIIVTGTHIRGVLEMSSPLQVMTRRQLLRTPYATVPDALQTITLNLGAIQGEVFGGTGNYGRGSAANLRNLGAGATLVLVNGRRQPQAGLQADFVDISNVPWSAVERIEVLPDGTSALYGSDAIAGVVNIILRNRIDGAETHLRHGGAMGGATETMLAQLVGDELARGRWLFGYQYSRRSHLPMSDRGYVGEADKRPWGGSDHRSIRSNPGNILDPLTLMPLYAIPPGQDGSSLDFDQLISGVNLHSPGSVRDLFADKTLHSVLANGSWWLGTHSELSAEVRWLHRETRANGPAESRLLVVPPSNPFNFAGTPLVVAYDFHRDLGPIAGLTRTQVLNAAVNLTSDVGADWQTTVSLGFGHERLNYRAINVLDPVALNAALADPDPARAFNPFGDGSHTAASTLEAIRTEQRNLARSDLSSFSVLADGPLFELPAGAVKLAFGAERREERLRRKLSRGPQSFGRRVAAAFTELSVPLVGDAHSLRTPPRLELALAGRYEQYSDFGGSFNPKAGLRWAPLQWLKLRTSFGTAFKAPKLLDLYDTSQNFAVLLPLADPLAPNKQSLVLAVQGNNENLQEETARTWTVGVDFTPTFFPGMSLSLTGYRIAYNDRIIVPGGATPFEILMHGDLWGMAITRNPDPAQVRAFCSSPIFIGVPSDCEETPPAVLVDLRLRNLAGTRVSGLDLKLDQQVDTRHGGLTLSLDGSYILTFEQRSTRASPPMNILNTAHNPVALRLRGGVEWRPSLAGRSDLVLGLTANHTGRYRNPASSLVPLVQAMTTLDLHASYRARNGLELTLIASNVFDADPPFIDHEWGYDYLNAEPLGRVVGLHLLKSW